MKKTILKNGFTVLTEEIPTTQSVTLSVFIKAGSYHEEHYPKGIAHFLEHMLFKGTTTRTAKELNEEMDGIGGLWNAYTNYEETKYHCSVLKDYWEKGTNLLLDIIWNHTLPAEDLEKERHVILNEIKMYGDDPQSTVFEDLHYALHFYQEERQSIIGTPDSVSSITREDLVSFVKEFYQPDNMVFVATGHIQHESLVQYIESFPASRSGKTVHTLTPFNPENLTPYDLTGEQDIQQAHLTWAIPTVPIQHKDLPVLELINTLIGESSSSRLYNRVREEEGLCYSVFTFNENHSDNGYLIGYVGTEKEDIEKAKTLVIEEFERLKTERITESELTRYLNSAKGAFAIQMETNAELNDFQGVSYLRGLPTDLESSMEELNQVTADDILRVANTYFRPERFFFCTMLPLDGENEQEEE